MLIADFTQKTLALFTEQLTDQLFLFIENDRNLMADNYKYFIIRFDY